MFQYAFALAHQNQLPTKGFADISHYADNLNHNGWEIEDVFELADALPTIDEFQSKQFRKLSKRSGLKIHEGTEAFYKPASFTPQKGHWTGYWQSYLYFKESDNLVRANFNFKNKSDIDSHPFTQKIEQTESVSVHIRRADYLSGENSAHFGGICTESYYSKAIKLMESRIPNAHFFIFSDDPAWCRQEFDGVEYTFVEGFSGKDSWKDMYLMSRCKHSIIANSSFSWWGMYLGTQQNRIVIGPNKFIHASLMLTKIQDFLPESAIRITATGEIAHQPSTNEC